MVPTLPPTDVAGVPQLQALLERVIFLVGGFGFIAVVVMLIIGAIRYITSGGDAKGIHQATGTITWALLGILFAAVAWLFLRLIEQFTGVQVTHFCIGFPPYCA